MLPLTMDETLIQEVPKAHSSEKILSEKEIRCLKRLDEFQDPVFSGSVKLEAVGVMIGIKLVSLSDQYDTDDFSSKHKFTELSRLLADVGLGVIIGEREPVQFFMDENDEIKPYLYSRLGVIYRSKDDAERALAIINKNKDYEIMDEDDKEIYRLSRDIGLTKDPLLRTRLETELLRNMSAINKKNHHKQDEEDQREIGRLLGYPRSGTDAFLGIRPRIEMGEAFNLLEGKDFAPLFQPLVMSRDNFREEIDAYGRKIMETMKEYMPKSYREYLVRYGVPEEYIDSVNNNVQINYKGSYKTN